MASLPLDGQQILCSQGVNKNYGSLTCLACNEDGQRYVYWRRTLVACHVKRAGQAVKQIIKPVSTRPWCSLIRTPDVPCMTRVTKTNRRRYVSQQLGTKSGSGPANKPDVNWTFGFPIGLHGTSLARASERYTRIKCAWYLGKYEGRLILGRTDRSASHPAGPPARAAALPSSVPM